ncbi:MAG: hypothetical protein ABSG99_08485 [Sedimentisphaerales bacterium]
MDIGDWLVSPNCALNEQIARQIFDVLPKQGPIVVIIDREGHRWVSNSEKFSKLNISESFLRELCAKIDDGTEPILTQVDDCSIIATQLNTGQTKASTELSRTCGYVIIALPQYNPESALINIDLIETILNQTGLIATLIEKNHHLCELQRKQLSSYTQSKASSN